MAPSGAHNPRLKESLQETRYISTGASRSDAHAGLDLTTAGDSLFDAEEERLFAKYLAEAPSSKEQEDHSSSDDDLRLLEDFEAALADALASPAETEANFDSLKVDVDQSILHAHSSQVHLANYREFIEKKKKQRTLCLRDLKTHCCTCKGPHIGKPPFSHAKGYRREPTHVQHQGTKCRFLKKKRSELRWLDETIGNFSKNTERFEREIARRHAETESRKGNLTEALANSLRLMELASLDFDDL
ncbi:hypothetical protein ACHAXT_006441 [Thalassiosira profunda]